MMVLKRTGGPIDWKEGRDVWMHEAMAKALLTDYLLLITAPIQRHVMRSRVGCCRLSVLRPTFCATRHPMLLAYCRKDRFALLSSCLEKIRYFSSTRLDRPASQRG